MTFDCQVGGINHVTAVEECPERESGGFWCEVRGPHTEHAIGEHTITHARAGNGWPCVSIERALREEQDS